MLNSLVSTDLEQLNRAKNVRANIHDRVIFCCCRIRRRQHVNNNLLAANRPSKISYVQKISINDINAFRGPMGSPRKHVEYGDTMLTHYESIHEVGSKKTVSANDENVSHALPPRRR